MLFSFVLFCLGAAGIDLGEREAVRNEEGRAGWS